LNNPAQELTIRHIVLELVLLRGEKKFNPHPQNRILAPLRGSFKNSRRVTPSLFIWEIPVLKRPYTSYRFDRLRLKQIKITKMENYDTAIKTALQLQS